MSKEQEQEKKNELLDFIENLNSDEANEIVKNNETLREVREKILKIKKEAYEDGEYDGIIEGKFKRSLDIAANLIVEGMQIEKISKITYLSLSKVELLKEEIRKIKEKTEEDNKTE